jgi:hypothetical protein
MIQTQLTMTIISHFTKEQIDVLFPEIATQLYLNGIDEQQLPFIVHTVYPSENWDLPNIGQNEAYAEIEADLVLTELWLCTNCVEAFGTPEEVLTALGEAGILSDKTSEFISDANVTFGEIEDIVDFMTDIYQTVDKAMEAENCFKLLDPPYIKLTLGKDLAFKHYNF